MSRSDWAQLTFVVTLIAGIWVGFWWLIDSDKWSAFRREFVCTSFVGKPETEQFVCNTYSRRGPASPTPEREP